MARTRDRRKPCSDCGGIKPPGRSRRYCDACQVDHVYARAEDQRRLGRNRHAAGKDGEFNRKRTYRRYGITAEQYEGLLAAQGGVCAICKWVPTDGRNRRLSIDHDHNTMEVRGLLCARCNMLIEYFTEFGPVIAAYLGKCPPSLLGHDG